jgi:hypothetical protein
MIDLSHITLAEAIAIFALFVFGSALREVISNVAHGRPVWGSRVGSRNGDDVKGHPPSNGSTTLLVGALNSLAEANNKIASFLSAIQEGQRIHEIELSRVREHIDQSTSLILEKLEAKGA